MGPNSFLSAPDDTPKVRAVREDPMQRGRVPRPTLARPVSLGIQLASQLLGAQPISQVPGEDPPDHHGLRRFNDQKSILYAVTVRGLDHPLALLEPPLHRQNDPFGDDLPLELGKAARSWSQKVR